MYTVYGVNIYYKSITETTTTKYCVEKTLCLHSFVQCSFLIKTEIYTNINILKNTERKDFYLTSLHRFCFNAPIDKKLLATKLTKFCQ